MLVDGDFANRVFFDSILHERFSKTFSAFFGQEKKHFDSLKFHAQEADGLPGFLFGDQNVLNIGKRFGNIFFDLQNFRIG